MSVIDTIQSIVPTGDSGPNSYRCPDCGREFEADSPPERTICSSCGNREVERTDE